MRERRREETHRGANQAGIRDELMERLLICVADCGLIFFFFFFFGAADDTHTLVTSGVGT